MFLCCLAQDFRCVTTVEAPEGGKPTYSACYCEDIHGGQYHHADNAGELSPVTAAASQISMVAIATENRLRFFDHAPREAFAYVTYGASEDGQLKLLPLKIVGPASM